METLKQLMFNLSVLIVLLFTYQTFHRRNGSKASGHALFLYFALGIAVSLLLSVNVSQEVRWDLRQIPLIIGTLYLGSTPGILLFLLVMVVRGFFGINEGFWICLAVFGIQTIAAITLHKWFLDQSIKVKVETAIILSLFSSFALMSLTYISGYILHWLDWAIYFGTGAFGAGAMTFIVETEKLNFLYRKNARSSEKMELVSQISASVSHEVRNPLAAVKGFLQLLRDPTFEHEKREEFIKISLHELERAENIITDYLSFAKPSISKSEELSLVDEIKHVLGVLEPLANMNSVELITSFEDQGYIKGDRNQLHQCFINLMKNSIEAMADGGELSVLAYRSGADMIIKISDTGVGMTDDQLRRLGEPYFSTKGLKGTGLGIPVSYSIVKAFKGQIQVNSKIGAGSTFTILLPATTQKTGTVPA